MDSKSFSGRPKNIALQERALAEAQRKLERIERMRAEMAKQVELEQKRLEEMRQIADDFTTGNKPIAEPNLSQSAPSSFESQFDKFKTTKSNDRLKSIGNEGIGSQAIDTFADKLATRSPTANESFYRTSDRDEHWTELNSYPGKSVYVSGYYYSSGKGTKEYEYKLEPSAYPIKIGDMVQADVHPVGYHTIAYHAKGGRDTGHSRRFIITDIYSKKKFYPYHDDIN